MESTDLDAELGKLAVLKKRRAFLRTALQIGALVSTSWMLFHVFRQFGVWAALATLLGMTVLYGLGVAPMLAIAGSILAFSFKAVGLWLPVVTYILGSLSIYFDFSLFQRELRLDPLGTFF